MNIHTLQEYQEWAIDTWTGLLPGTKQGRFYLTLKLAGEAGEVAEKMGKLIRDKGGWDHIGREDLHALTLELGDVFWYLSVLAYDLGITLEEVANANISKLQNRKERGVLKGSGDNR